MDLFGLNKRLVKIQPDCQLFNRQHSQISSSSNIVRIIIQPLRKMFLRFSFVLFMFVQFCVTVNSYPSIFSDEYIKDFADEPKIAFDDGVTAALDNSTVEVSDGISQQKMGLNVVPSLKSAVNSTTDLSSLNMDRKKRQSGEEPSVSETVKALGANKPADVQQFVTLNATENAAHLRSNKRPVSVNNAKSSSTSNSEESRWSRANSAILRRLKSLFSTNDNSDARNKRSVENPVENDNGEEENSAEQDRNQSEESYDELLEKDLDTPTTELNLPIQF